MAELYKLVIDKARTEEHFPSGRKGIYFGENGSYQMIEACKAYSKALFDAGKARPPEPEAFTENEINYGTAVSIPYRLHWSSTG